MEILRNFGFVSAAAVLAVATAGCGSDRDAKQAKQGQTPYYESAAQQRTGSAQGRSAERGRQRQAPSVVLLELEPLGPPAGEATPGDAQPQAEAGYDWSLVDPGYRQLVQGFANDVRMLVNKGQPLEEAQHTLELLAHAIETIPAPQSANLLAAAEKIRAQAQKIDGDDKGKESQAKRRRAVKEGLDTAAATMKRLAEGSYAAAPNVGEQVRELSRAVENINESDIVWTNRGAAYTALTEASEALRAFELAIASGRVDAGSFRRPMP